MWVYYEILDLKILIEFYSKKAKDGKEKKYSI